MNGVIAGSKWEAISSGNGDFWTVENMRVLFNGGGVSLSKWARVQRNTIAFSDVNVFCFDGCLVEDNTISSGRIGVSIKSGAIVRNSPSTTSFMAYRERQLHLGELLVTARIHSLEIIRGMHRCLTPRQLTRISALPRANNSTATPWNGSLRRFRNAVQVRTPGRP